MAIEGPWGPPLPPPDPPDYIPPRPGPPAAPMQVEATSPPEVPPDEPPMPGPPAAPARRSWLWWLGVALVIASLVMIVVYARRKTNESPTSKPVPTTVRAVDSTAAPTTAAVPTTEGRVATTPAPATTVSRPTTTVTRTTTVVATTTTAPSTTAAPTTTAPPATTGTPTTVPTGGALPDGVVLTVATPLGARSVSALGEIPVSLGAGDVAITFADGAGTGVIYQAGAAAADPEDATDIIRVRPDGSQLILYPATRGRTLRLHDVRVVDGRPEVLYSVSSGNTPDTAIETLVLARPVAGSLLELGTVGGWENSTGRLHFGGDLIVGESVNEELTELFTLTTTGQPGPPASLYGVDVPQAACGGCPARHFTIDAGGTRVGWLAGNDLVVADRTTGARLSRTPIPVDLLGDVSDLQIGEGIAVINYFPRPEGPRAALVVDFRGAAVRFVESPVVGYADLA